MERKSAVNHRGDRGTVPQVAEVYGVAVGVIERVLREA
jgi:hypothetical protein